MSDLPVIDGQCSRLFSMLVLAVGKFIAPYLPEAMFQALGFVGSFFVITLLFAMMFKWLPTPHRLARRLARSDPDRGAVELGNFVIGVYIGEQALESTYGAAASMW